MRKLFCLSSPILLFLLISSTICTGVFAPDDTLAVSGVYSNSIARSAATLPYDPIDYSEIGLKLREIEKKSSRVRVEVMGQSTGGRDLYLVTITTPDGLRRLGHYRQIRRLMTHNPERAQDTIERLDDFKLPFFVNGGTHGIELPGVDACMELIEHFAYDESAETLEILENFILLINPIQNPDGRVNGTRVNGYGINLNRDFITQSQPETKALAAVLADWNPLVLLDLHGFMPTLLIEPCTPPHNPNYEYDLYLEWALAQALAMKAEVKEQLGMDSVIPILEMADAWDDWPPIYAPQYAMYHGSYSHTLEAPFPVGRTRCRGPGDGGYGGSEVRGQKQAGNGYGPDRNIPPGISRSSPAACQPGNSGPDTI